MPIVDNTRVPRLPWRPGYHRCALAGEEQGISCSVSYSVLEPGAGAPLHLHEDVDEVLLLLRGRLDVTIGETRETVGSDHTVVFPAGTPHSFTAVGPEAAHIVGFVPKVDLLHATIYLEGGPPRGSAVPTPRVSEDLREGSEEHSR